MAHSSDTVVSEIVLCPPSGVLFFVLFFSMVIKYKILSYNWERMPPYTEQERSNVPIKNVKCTKPRDIETYRQWDEGCTKVHLSGAQNNEICREREGRIEMEAPRLQQIYTVTVFLEGGQFVFEFYFFFLQVGEIRRYESSLGVGSDILSTVWFIVQYK